MHIVNAKDRVLIESTEPITSLNAQMPTMHSMLLTDRVGNPTKNQARVARLRVIIFRVVHTGFEYHPNLFGITRACESFLISGQLILFPQGSTTILTLHFKRYP